MSYELTARYTCRGCENTVTVLKARHIHEHQLCEACYHHVQSYLDV